MANLIKTAVLAAGFCTAVGAMAVERPKLVVGIVVDQMRWDYLYRYGDRFGEGGFKRLMNEGFSCSNTMLNYIPTYTAVGHSSIYTGSVPSVHGIAANDFCIDGNRVYCTYDAGENTVGGKNDAGKMSPRNLLATTIGDELKLATNFRGKVVGVSLKDRASILPAGHGADGAYWFDDASGKFITSTYYMDKLPKWVEDFNKKDMARDLLKEGWTAMYPMDTYVESTADMSAYEKSWSGGAAPVLPLNTDSLFRKKGYGIIRTTPQGAELTLEMAEAAIEGEKLGQDNITDLLAVSISTTDYIGHQFGTYAVETEDAYLRLDKSLADFFTMLDSKVGKGNYTVFLTADHAASHNFKFMQDNGMPADGWVTGKLSGALQKHLADKFGQDKLVKYVMNYQVFFYKNKIAEAELDFETVRTEAVKFLRGYKEFAYVVDMENICGSSVPSIIKERIINGYNRLRSGDIQLILQPGWYEVGSASDNKGTTHGVWNPCDTHIPLLFMGWGVGHGKTNARVNITDIAPTVCALLNIQMPDGCIGTAILPVMGE